MMSNEMKTAIGGKRESLGVRLKKNGFYYLFGLPGIIILIVFCYFPMKYLLMAFQNYNPFLGISGSEWVAFKHFEKLFHDVKFYSMLKNTLVISGLTLLTFPAPIILALILNEVRSLTYKKLVQTAVYLPHFLSWAIIVSLTFLLLSDQEGLINKIALQLGYDTHKYLFDKNWTYPILVIQSVWKNIGWGSIVYLAAIAGIDQELYEAAKIDGANKLKMMWRITLPCIMPTIVVMLILRMGTIISVDFEQVFLMSNAMNRSQTEVFELYIYKYGIASGSTQLSYTTAIGLFKSAVNTLLVILTNAIVSRRGYEGVM